MKALIVYDSVFGNTRKLAEAIAAGLDAKAVPVSDISAQEVSQAALLLVGSPTRAFRPTPAITEWLKNLPNGTLQGMRAAAFDSRISADKVKSRALKFMMNKCGYAAPLIDNELKKKGASIAAAPEGFFVEESEGPLTEGEEARAKEWAKALA
ncbi:MAG: flavodoxin family protein [Bacillota bacterium]